MTEPTTFQPVWIDSSDTMEVHQSSDENTRNHPKESSFLGMAWMASGWAVAGLATVALVYGFGKLTGSFAASFEGDAFFSTPMLGGGVGGPLAVLVGLFLMLRRRQGASGSTVLLHYSLLLIASFLAIFPFGMLLSVLMWVFLTLGLVFVESVPSWGVLWAGLGALVGGVALFTGAYLQRGQVGKWTFILLSVWLVVGAGIHVPLANPDRYLFADLSLGSAGAMLVVIAAARPLYNQDSIREGWRARLRYYAGAFLFTMGTIGVFFLGEGLMGWIVG